MPMFNPMPPHNTICRREVPRSDGQRHFTSTSIASLALVGMVILVIFAFGVRALCRSLHAKRDHRRQEVLGAPRVSSWKMGKSSDENGWICVTHSAASHAEYDAGEKDAHSGFSSKPSLHDSVPLAVMLPAPTHGKEPSPQHEVFSVHGENVVALPSIILQGSLTPPGITAPPRYNP